MSLRVAPIVARHVSTIAAIVHDAQAGQSRGFVTLSSACVVIS